MTDETATQSDAAAPHDERSTDAAPTPEELLAETESDDPDVGIDGTGVGELP